MAAPFVIPSGLQAPLDQIAVPKAFSALTVMFRRGDPVVGVYLIRVGTVALSLPNAAEPPHLAGPGAVLGIPAAICDRPYSLTAETLEPVEAGFLTREQFVAVVKQHPDLCLALIETLAAALSDTRRQASALLGQFSALG